MIRKQSSTRWQSCCVCKDNGRYKMRRWPASIAQFVSQENRKKRKCSTDRMNKFAAVLLVASVACLASVSAQCPRIVTRAQWGARAANTAQLPIRPAPWVVMHHTAGAHCTTDAACATQMRNIQNFHMNSNGWADIGYNFLVGENGAAYEGRGWGRQGAHAPGYNDRSVGMGVIGTFTNGIPNAAARNAAQQLISCGVSLGHIASNYWLIGHRQAVATACPGNAFFNEIRNWPRFNPNV